MGKKRTDDRAARFSKLKAADIAFIFGVTPPAVGLWVKNSGCPRAADGTFDLRAVTRWRIEALTEGDAGDSSEALERWRRLKADREAIALQRDREQVIDRQEVEAGNVARVTSVRIGLSHLPRLLAPRLEGKKAAEIFDEIDQEVRRLCDSFARSGPLPQEQNNGSAYPN